MDDNYSGGWKCMGKEVVDSDRLYCELEAAAGTEDRPKTLRIANAVREFASMLQFAGPKIRKFAAFALAECCERNRVDLEEAKRWLNG